MNISFNRQAICLIVISVSLCFFSALNLKAQCFGGQIFTGAGMNQTSICPEIAAERGLDFYNNSNVPTNYAYVITDINNTILFTSTSSNLRFENLVEGSYFVYGFSYLGEILANSGDFVFGTRFSSECWQISSSRVEVQLVSPRVSQIRTDNFQTSRNICLNNGDSSFIGFQNIAQQNSPFVFIVTDENDSILRVTSNNNIDFSNLPFGELRVYGLAYTGELRANFGVNVNNFLATGCFELSSDWVTINRNNANGGTISTTNFMSFHKFVSDDGVVNRLDFSNSGSSSADYAFLLTDESNNVIRILDEPNIDFEGFADGVFRVWGYSFTGDILLTPGQSVFTNPFSNGCFQRSSNAITVTTETTGLMPPACNLSPVSISSLNETTFCQNSSMQEIITDAAMSIEGASQLLIVDANNIIQLIEQTPEINIAALGPGSYTLFQIVFFQIENLILRQSLNDIEGCFVLSNGIAITKLEADNLQCTQSPECALEPSLFSVDRTTVCAEDPNANTVFFNVGNGNQAEEAIIITDENGIIQELSADRIFQINTVGVSIYYHISFLETVQIFGGTSIFDLEGCFVLSEAIEITGLGNCFTTPCDVIPGLVSLNTSAELCATDPSDDMVSVTSIGGTGEEQVFLLVDPLSQNILDSNTSGSFRISDDMIGEFEVFTLDYQTPFVFAENVSELEGCFALSEGVNVENSLDNCTVDPEACINEGGFIVNNGASGICGNDGQNDILDIQVLSEGGNNRVFLVVNDAGTIVNIAPALVILSNPFPEGFYNIYTLSYDVFPSEVMTNANLNQIDDLCLSNGLSILVSDDFCEGEGVRGGQVSNEFNEDDILLCTNISGEVFTVNLETTGSVAFDYIFIETDEDNVITEIINGESIMYIADPTEIQNKRIWGVSFTGMFTAFVGETITSVLLSDDTFSLSDTFIDVEVAAVVADDPVIAGAEAPFLEIPSNQIFSIDFEAPLSSFLDFETAYVLFDIDGVSIIDVLFPDDNFVITLPPVEATPLSGELLTLTAVAYTGDFLLGPGDQADSAFLPNASNVTTGCFDVASTNISIRVFENNTGGLVIPLGEEVRAYNDSEEISLRPNPVRDRLIVTFPSSFVGQKVDLNIFDTSGKLVYKKNYFGAPEREAIDVSNYSNGNYILQAYTNQSARTAPFLKI